MWSILSFRKEGTKQFLELTVDFLTAFYEVMHVVRDNCFDYKEICSDKV